MTTRSCSKYEELSKEKDEKKFSFEKDKIKYTFTIKHIFELFERPLNIAMLGSIGVEYKRELRAKEHTITRGVYPGVNIIISNKEGWQSTLI